MLSKPIVLMIGVLIVLLSMLLLKINVGIVVSVEFLDLFANRSMIS